MLGKSKFNLAELLKSLQKPELTAKQKKAREMSGEEVMALDDDERREVLTEKLKASFGPINMVARSPQALAGRLAIRGITGAADAIGGKETVETAQDVLEELPEAADKAADKAAEYIEEVTPIRDAEEELLTQEEFKKMKPSDQMKQVRDILEGKGRKLDVNDFDPHKPSPASTPQTPPIPDNIGKELGRILTKKAEEQAKKKANKAAKEIAAKVAANWAQVAHTRLTGNQRYNDRRAEAIARGEVPEERRFRDIVAEQLVPGSRHASPEGGISTRLLAYGQRQRDKFKK
jgi:hypothetical protein